MTDSRATTHHRIEIWKCRWFSTLEPPLPTKFQHFTASMLDLCKGLPWEYRVFLKQTRCLFNPFSSPCFLHPNHPRLAASSTKASGWHTCDSNVHFVLVTHSQHPKAHPSIRWNNFSLRILWNSNLFRGRSIFRFISEDLNMIRGSTTSNTWVLGRPLHRSSWWSWVETQLVS